MKLVKDMTEDELRTALRWCMGQLQEHWKGRFWSETWGQEGSPWGSEAKFMEPYIERSEIGEAT